MTSMEFLPGDLVMISRQMHVTNVSTGKLAFFKSHEPLILVSARFHENGEMLCTLFNSPGSLYSTIFYPKEFHDLIRKFNEH